MSTPFLDRVFGHEYAQYVVLACMSPNCGWGAWRVHPDLHVVPAPSCGSCLGAGQVLRRLASRLGSASQLHNTVGMTLRHDTMQQCHNVTFYVACGPSSGVQAPCSSGVVGCRAAPALRYMDTGGSRPLWSLLVCPLISELVSAVRQPWACTSMGAHVLLHVCTSSTNSSLLQGGQLHAQRLAQAWAGANSNLRRIHCMHSASVYALSLPCCFGAQGAGASCASATGTREVVANKFRLLWPVVLACRSCWALCVFLGGCCLCVCVC